MSSVEIKITGVSDVRGLKKKPKRKRVSRPKKKKGISELKKRPEFFTTQFTQRPTYIERPPTAQPSIDYRPMFDKLMLQQLLLQNKSNNFRQQEVLATTTLAKNQPSFSSVSVSEIMDDEEKKELQQINQEALERATMEEAKRIDFEEDSKSDITGIKKQIKDLEKKQQQSLSSLGIPAETLKDIQKRTKKKLIIK